MPNFTKEAIKRSFLKLLNEKPLGKITVKDIVEDCGINRNSFYYHFSDLPALVETIIIEEFDRVIREYPSIGSIEECLIVATEFTLQNKKAVMHLYSSSNKELYEKYLWRICEYVVTAYINTAFAGRNISEADRAFLIRILKCLFFGGISDWLAGNMAHDIKADIHRLCELCGGLLESVVAKCESGGSG